MHSIHHRAGAGAGVGVGADADAMCCPCAPGYDESADQ
jgi:hypothetical protein